MKSEQERRFIMTNIPVSGGDSHKTKTSSIEILIWYSINGYSSCCGISKSITIRLLNDSCE